jgi:hypothetical protein
MNAFSTTTNGNQLSYAWQQQAGNFTLASGVASTVGTGLALATLNGLNATTVTVQSNVTVANVAGSKAGLVAEYSQSTGFYYVGQISANGSSSYAAQIDLIENGVVKKLVKKMSFTHKGGITGTLKFSVSGGTLSLSMAGLVSLTGSDTTLNAGTVGILGAMAMFSNFKAS